ncbi:MAG: M20/M25/M40 family metallo-hydrolase [Actinomycetota bacterium]|nr:MAG: M20/M25/M40 family metallo-hydrolase [Actinomycetota bacterium]
MNKGSINNKRLVNTFLKLASIKSPSGNEKEIVDHVWKILSGLGLSVDIDDSGKNYGSNSGNITAFLKGNDPDIMPIFLGAHLDTVALNGEVVPYIKNGIIKNKNKNCILGGDDKVAVAAIIEILRYIVENNIKTGNIYIIFTISEEIGVIGAKYVDMEKIGAKYGFVFDSHGDIGTIYNQAPYQNSIDAEFIGKAAHAGIEPEKGLNSIKAAAIAISNIRFGRLDQQTTANIGKIEGGMARNIVPASTRMLLEARSLEESKLETVTAEMMASLKSASTDTGCRLKYELIREYDGFTIMPEEIPLKIASDAIKKTGIRPKIASSGGGSDINVFNSKGKRAVNLSSGMENVHTDSEYVKISQLEKLAQLILEICKSQYKNRSHPVF